MEGFKCRLRLQLRFKDIDSMGHVNNANHLTYFELARIHYFDEVIAEPIDWQKEGIILARAEIDYRSPILLSDEVWIYCRVSRIGNSSFDMEYRIVCIAGGQERIAALGKSVQVCYSYQRQEAMPVPRSWREKADLYEGGL